MGANKPRRITIYVDEDRAVSGLLRVPASARACYVMAHGAGAGIEHPFMTSVADELMSQSVATLLYQFPYMERGSRRPDSPAVAQAAVHAAVREAARLFTELPLVAGGKSFGGRMTSQAQAAAPLENVRGLAFFGFPLHPAAKPSIQRARHLTDVTVPMLFLQGGRDKLASLELIGPLVSELGQRATLALFEHADHSFHVLKRSGTTDEKVLRSAVGVLVDWIDDLL